MEASAHPALRVLIVDDSRAIQAIISRVLESAQLGALEIQTANNGEQALQQIASFAPDLVISDWHMPVVSGIEMLQTLRQLGGGAIKVGFVTTETAEHHLDQARSNGAVFVINKPFKEDVLLREVQAALAARIEQLKSPPPAAAVTSEQAMSQLISAQLGKIPFRLIPVAAQSMSDLQLPHNLAVYGSDGNKTPHALGILDVNACCILGGGGAQLQPYPVRAAMQGARPTADMMKFADQFLRNSAQILVRDAGSPDISLKLINLLPKPFDKLQSLMQRNAGRSDYRISVPGYGEGRMAFIRF